MEVSLGEKSSVQRSRETKHSYSINHVGRESCGHSSQETSYCTSINHVGHGCRSSLPATIPLVLAEDMLIEADVNHSIPGTIPMEIS